MWDGSSQREFCLIYITDEVDNPLCFDAFLRDKIAAEITSQSEVSISLPKIMSWGLWPVAKQAN